MKDVATINNVPISRKQALEALAEMDKPDLPIFRTGDIVKRKIDGSEYIVLNKVVAKHIARLYSGYLEQSIWVVAFRGNTSAGDIYPFNPSEIEHSKL